MNELKLILWRIPGHHLPAKASQMAALDVNYASNPDLYGHLADGWRVVSHTILPIDQDLLLTLFLERPVVVPDDIAAVEDPDRQDG